MLPLVSSLPSCHILSLPPVEDYLHLASAILGLHVMPCPPSSAESHFPLSWSQQFQICLGLSLVPEVTLSLCISLTVFQIADSGLKPHFLTFFSLGCCQWRDLWQNDNTLFCSLTILQEFLLVSNLRSVPCGLCSFLTFPIDLTTFWQCPFT